MKTAVRILIVVSIFACWGRTAPPASTSPSQVAVDDPGDDADGLASTAQMVTTAAALVEGHFEICALRAQLNTISNTADAAAPKDIKALRENLTAVSKTVSQFVPDTELQARVSGLIERTQAALAKVAENYKRREEAAGAADNAKQRKSIRTIALQEFERSRRLFSSPLADAVAELDAWIQKDTARSANALALVSKLAEKSDVQAMRALDQFSQGGLVEDSAAQKLNGASNGKTPNWLAATDAEHLAKQLDSQVKSAQAGSSATLFFGRPRFMVEVGERAESTRVDTDRTSWRFGVKWIVIPDDWTAPPLEDAEPKVLSQTGFYSEQSGAREVFGEALKNRAALVICVHASNKEATYLVLPINEKNAAVVSMAQQLASGSHVLAEWRLSRAHATAKAQNGQVATFFLCEALACRAVSPLQPVAVRSLAEYDAQWKENFAAVRLAGAEVLARREAERQRQIQSAEHRDNTVACRKCGGVGYITGFSSGMPSRAPPMPGQPGTGSGTERSINICPVCGGTGAVAKKYGPGAN